MPKVERASLDGTHRTILLQKKQVSRGPVSIVHLFILQTVSIFRLVITGGNTVMPERISSVNTLGESFNVLRS